MNAIDVIKAFINNAWVISFVSGIGSSVIVGYISGFIAKKREEIRYEQQIQEGNNEIAKALDAFIAIYVVPNELTVESIIYGAAYRRRISPSSLPGAREVYQLLMYQMAQSPLIPAASKRAYFETVNYAIWLLDSRRLQGTVSMQGASEERMRHLYSGANRNTSSVIIAFVTAVVVSLIMYAIMNTNQIDLTPIPDTGNSYVTAGFGNSALSLLAAVVTTYAIYIATKFRHNKRKEKTEEDGAIGSSTSA